jgi:hypothetical protein
LYAIDQRLAKLHDAVLQVMTVVIYIFAFLQHTNLQKIVQLHQAITFESGTPQPIEMTIFAISTRRYFQASCTFVATRLGEPSSCAQK